MTTKYSLKEIDKILNPRKGYDVLEVLKSIIIHLVGENKFIPIPDTFQENQQNFGYYNFMRVNGLIVIDHELFATVFCDNWYDTQEHYFGKVACITEDEHAGPRYETKSGINIFNYALWDLCELLLDEDFSLNVKSDFKDKHHLAQLFGECDKETLKDEFYCYNKYAKPFLKTKLDSFVNNNEKLYLMGEIHYER